MRKRIVLTTLFLSVWFANAQDVDFGFTAGYLNAEASIKADDIKLSASESGFYIGAVADLTVTASFHIQPEFVYANIKDSDALFLPVMGKFYVSDRFNLQAGPQLVITLEEVPDDFTGIGIDLAGGLGFDITDEFFAEARYSFQLNNTYTGDEDVTVRGNYLMLGVGITF